MNGKKAKGSLTEKGGASGEEQNVPRPPVKPQIAKPPPPKPPSAYANDKLILESISEAAGKGAIKGKGEEQGNPKWGNDAKGIGKSTKGKKGATVAQTDDARGVYTSYTAQEKELWLTEAERRMGEGALSR